jgi:hypothetical protein
LVQDNSGCGNAPGPGYASPYTRGAEGLPSDRGKENVKSYAVFLTLCLIGGSFVWWLYNGYPSFFLQSISNTSSI